MRTFYFHLLIVLVTVLALSRCRKNKEDPMSPVVSEIKADGIAFVAPRDQFGDTVMATIAANEVGWVQLIPYGFCQPGDPQVHYSGTGQWWGETLAGMRYSIQSAHQNGMEVLLKPHIWISGMGWAGEYGQDNDADWDAWEASYRDYVMTFAEMAEEEGVAMFCIGTELKKVVTDRPGLFARLADSVRTVYGGDITYAANWDNYENVDFWSMLDVIGIDAYFPLSADAEPDVATLEAAWAPIKSDLEALSGAENRPLCFTEWGYHSVSQAAWRNWELEANIGDQTVSMQAQVNAYRALFNTFWEEPWFAGGFTWHWFYNNSAVGGPTDKGYSPQNKPALEVLREFYGQQ